MDEEDDDFYDPADAVPISQAPNDALQSVNAQPQETVEEEEEVEVEDDVRSAEDFPDVTRIY